MSVPASFLPLLVLCLIDPKRSLFGNHAKLQPLALIIEENSALKKIEAVQDFRDLVIVDVPALKQVTRSSWIHVPRHLPSAIIVFGNVEPEVLLRADNPRISVIGQPLANERIRQLVL